MIENNHPKAQGERIKALRKRLRLSRRAFAQRQHVSASTLQALEEGLYKAGLTVKNSTALIAAFKNEGLHVEYRWLVEGLGDVPKSIHLVSLPPVKSPNALNPEGVLARTERNHLIMEQNKNAVAAIKNQALTKLEMAIANGANAHELKAQGLYILTGPKQDTLLHLAGQYANRDIITYLVTQLSMHPTIRNRDMETPAHAACCSNHAAGLRTLIELGTTIEAGSRDAITPFMLAAYLGHIDCMAILLQHYANSQNTDINGNTAAHWAAYNDKVEALRFLYQHGVVMFPLNHDKKTPLDLACQNGHTNAVEYLLSIR